MPGLLYKISFRRWGSIPFLLLCLSSCQMFSRPHSPKGYFLPKPKVTFLNKELAEVSGVCFLDKENAFLAISDSKQYVYRLTNDGIASRYYADSIGPRTDYEDVVKVDTSTFVLASNGVILEINQSDSGQHTTTYSLTGDSLSLKVKHNFNSYGKKKFSIKDKGEKQNDFETLYYDSSQHALIMLCKSCKGENKQDIRTAYKFDLTTRQFDSEPFYTINSKDIKNIFKDGQVEFKPSAAAIHPIEKRLYILSSAGHLLVITDLLGKVQEVYRLNPTFYPQAEGIAFAANGDMYISNEAKMGKPTLLKIAYNPPGKNKKNR